MSFEVKHIGSATLYLGDCREVMQTLCSIDATICDPPYGVDLKFTKTKHAVRTHDLVYDDSEQNFRTVVIPSVSRAIEISKRSAFFTGVRRLQEYPIASDIGGIFRPNGTGLTRWGFTCFHPVAFYGKRPRNGCWPTVKSIVQLPRKDIIDHPCPKPIAFMEWLVDKASNPGELVMDPFMGSGTTGVACAKLGRRFIGIEIEPRYFEVSCERIAKAQAELAMAA